VPERLIANNCRYLWSSTYVGLKKHTYTYIGVIIIFFFSFDDRRFLNTSCLRVRYSTHVYTFLFTKYKLYYVNLMGYRV